MTKISTTLCVFALLVTAAPSWGWLVHTPGHLAKPILRRSLARDLDNWALSDFRTMIDAISDDILDHDDIDDTIAASAPGSFRGKRHPHNLALASSRSGEITGLELRRPTFDWTETKDGGFLLTVRLAIDTMPWSLLPGRAFQASAFLPTALS